MSYEDVAQRQSSATCHQCPSMLKDMDSLRRHLDRAYRDSRDGSSAAYDPAQASELSKAPFACPFGDVDGIFEFSRLKYHVETVHQHCLPQQALRFDSYDYAKSWIESLWKTNKARFIQLNDQSFCTDGSFSQTWVCRRSGRHPYTERSYEFGGDHLASRPYQKPTCKLESSCASHIFLKSLPDGSVDVVFYDTHSGHDPLTESVGFMRLPKSMILSIQVPLEQGVPTPTFVASCNALLRDRNRREDLQQAPSRDMFVTLQDVYNVKAKFDFLANLG